MGHISKSIIFLCFDIYVIKLQLPYFQTYYIVLTCYFPSCMQLLQKGMDLPKKEDNLSRVTVF